MEHDVVAATSEQAVNRVFREVREGLNHAVDVDESSGAFRILGNITFDIPRGDIIFVPGGADFVRLDEVDLRTDINLILRVRIPEIAIPRVCITIPCNGRVCTPKIVLVPSQTITIPLDLPPITSEISGDGFIVPELDTVAKKWNLRLQLNPLTVDLDLIDVADTLGDLFETVAREVLEGLFGSVGSIIFDLIGEPIVWLIRTVLDIADDISEFFFRLLSDTLGLHEILADFLETLTGKIIVAKIDSEQEILEDDLSNDVPVTVQITELKLDITEDRELVLGATIQP